MKNKISQIELHLSSFRRRFSSTATSTTIIESAKKSPLVCTTILAGNKTEFLTTARKAARLGCDIAELRIDRFKDPNASLIREMITSSPLPLIVTNRSERDGGLFPKPKESLRLSLIRASLDFSPAFVDIELYLTDENRSNLIQLARKKKVGVICSHHDFHSTPKTDQILELAERVFVSGADIAKLVFMPRHNQDAANILEAANVLGDRREMFTIFGMGEKGQITRLASLIFGGCLIYCSLGRVDKKLGQIGVRYVRRYLDAMQVHGWSKLDHERSQLLSILQRELARGRKVSYQFNPIDVLDRNKRLSNSRIFERSQKDL